MSSGMYSITDNPFRKKKLRQDISLQLSDNRKIDGKIFVGYNERILDVLNDKRTFIPVEDEDGNIIIISKDSIVSVDTQHVTAFSTKKDGEASVLNAGSAQPIIRHYDGISPYKVLELPENCDIAKVRKRYLKIRELLNISALEDAGVDRVMLSLSKLYLTQIENAYQIIARMDMQTNAISGEEGDNEDPEYYEDE